MSIFKKLQKARVMLQERELKKSGKNSFAKYEYFELSDFLPFAQSIFYEVGLCPVISFSNEYATLTLFDCESSENIDFKSPMAEAELKGCHSIQNLGAVQTYQRRYLYMTALEIVEHDALDATTGSKQEINYKKLIEEANTIEQLQIAWSTIPRDLNKQFEQIKNKRKAELSKPMVAENV